VRQYGLLSKRQLVFLFCLCKRSSLF